MLRLWQWRGTREPAVEESGEVGAGGSGYVLESAAIQEESAQDEKKVKHGGRRAPPASPMQPWARRPSSVQVKTTTLACCCYLGLLHFRDWQELRECAGKGLGNGKKSLLNNSPAQNNQTHLPHPTHDSEGTMTSLTPRRTPSMPDDCLDDDQQNCMAFVLPRSRKPAAHRGPLQTGLESPCVVSRAVTADKNGGSERMFPAGSVRGRSTQRTPNTQCNPANIKHPSTAPTKNPTHASRSGHQRVAPGST